MKAIFAWVELKKSGAMKIRRICIRPVVTRIMCNTHTVHMCNRAIYVIYYATACDLLPGTFGLEDTGVTIGVLYRFKH